MGIPQSIKLTGKVYIKYFDENIYPLLGDILLILNDDSIAHYEINDKSTNLNGYIKAQIFDGLKWQNMDIAEFCENNENKLLKKQRVADTLQLCKEIMNQQNGIEIFKKYRGHFSRQQHIQQEYNRGGRYSKLKK